jgi:hypothetical protein
MAPVARHPIAWPQGFGWRVADIGASALPTAEGTQRLETPFTGEAFDSELTSGQGWRFRDRPAPIEAGLALANNGACQAIFARLGEDSRPANNQFHYRPSRNRLSS